MNTQNRSLSLSVMLREFERSKRCRVLQVPEQKDLTVSNIYFDSRRVSPGSAFFAVRGSQTDGHRFIDSALKNGATLVVLEEDPTSYQKEYPNCEFIQTDNSAAALGLAASAFYGYPSRKLKLVGVTGTNGKTTCVTLLYKLFRKLGYNVGMLSTIRNLVNEKAFDATHTTPDPIGLNAMLAEMVEAKCTHAFMEVSSHALHQCRTAGLDFDGAVFTNISHDHLDYHETFKAYIDAKKLFFDFLKKSAFALVNADDKRGEVMLQNCAAKHFRFALKNPAQFKARLLADTFEGLEMEFHIPVQFRLVGSFNAYNLLCVFASADLLGEDKDEVLTELSALESAEGRFERISSKSGKNIVIDYAHTPDALENVLKTLDKLREGRRKIITVVGCGGNRDKEKRPKMAQIAVQYSDKSIFTSDNPRDEEPMQIIEDMMTGPDAAAKARVLTQADRKEAIRTAVFLAAAGDIVLVAGKGHETYQEIKGIRKPFDDRKIVYEVIGEE